MRDLLNSAEFQIALMLFTALGGYLLASRLRQPAVAGVILAGIVIGPAGLNLIRYTEGIGYLGHMGAIVLLFVLGLEFNLRSLFRFRYFLIALAGVLVPWLGGFITASIFGFEYEKALIIGAALTATSLAITAATLTEMGYLRTTAGEAIIGAAILDDIMALTALAISQQLADGNVQPMIVAWLIVKAAIFLTAGLVFGIKCISPLMNRIDHSRISEQYPEFAFVLAMMLAFLYSLLAEAMALSAIVGAFVAGVSLEGVVIDKSKSIREGAEYLRVIFGIIFFISLGVLADFRIVDMNAVILAVALTIVAIATKLVGCGLMARMVGLGTRDSIIVGVGMAPRGEVAMTIGLFAYLSGIIAQPTLVAIVLMSLLTAVLVPPALKRLYARPADKAETQT